MNKTIHILLKAINFSSFKIRFYYFNVKLNFKNRSKLAYQTLKTNQKKLLLKELNYPKYIHKNYIKKMLS